MSGISQPALKDTLSKLIEIPSVSSTLPQLDMGNLSVIHELASWLEGMGFVCEIQPMPYDPNKANLIATLGKGSGGLVLAGHTDTVPFDESLWKSAPFTLNERDGKFYGLGVCDMKGFFAIAMEAVREYLETPLKAPLIILATADEESSMNGAKALVDLGRPKARYAVVGEPTGMRPIHMHKGIMMERIEIQGLSGHSSDPSLGRNAMESAHKVISELMRFRTELAERYQNPGFTIPTPTLNLGCIHGGDNPNRICGHCSLDFDIRLIPGMDSKMLRDELNHRLRPIAEADRVDINLQAITPAIMPFSGIENSPLVAACEALTGHTAESVAFGTEAPFFSQMGMDTVILGPGDIDQAHQPDEFLALNRINPMIELLRNLISKYCL
ncbi:acetylornithine deacetylase [Endozoicomonas sp. (ex Bugula neritina AB1)]|nr:acetylornithine deacetylase [Endozoicomonas sp. (ex Bugula neritina AB1)]